jgi:predicted phosphatase
LPQFIWLAVGSLTNLNAEKCSVLKGRNVILFPDLNGFDKWSNKAKELSHLAIFTVSDLLERKATEAERKQGFDLADYLIKYDCKTFALTKPEAPTEPPPAVQTFVEVETTPIERVSYGNNWLTDIEALEAILKKNVHKTTIKLKNGGTIINLEKFIEAHLETVKFNNGNKAFLPYLNRLQELKHKFINHKV